MDKDQTSKTWEEVESEAAEEKAILPIKGVDVRIVSDEVAVQKVPDIGKEHIFVYVKGTDRTRYVLNVVARMSDSQDNDFVNRAVIMFEEGFSEEFSIEIGLEIAEMIIGVTKESNQVHIKKYLNATPEMIVRFKDQIIY